MSKEQAKEFFEAISKDKQLAEEVKDVVYGQATNQEKAKEILSLAKAHNFNFTEDELKRSLNREDLADIAGGSGLGSTLINLAASTLQALGVGGTVNQPRVPLPIVNVQQVACNAENQGEEQEDGKNEVPPEAVAEENEVEEMRELTPEEIAERQRREAQEQRELEARVARGPLELDEPEPNWFEDDGTNRLIREIQDDALSVRIERLNTLYQRLPHAPHCQELMDRIRNYIATANDTLPAGTASLQKQISIADDLIHEAEEMLKRAEQQRGEEIAEELREEIQQGLDALVLILQQMHTGLPGETDLYTDVQTFLANRESYTLYDRIDHAKKLLDRTYLFHRTVDKNGPLHRDKAYDLFYSPIVYLDFLRGEGNYKKALLEGNLEQNALPWLAQASAYSVAPGMYELALEIREFLATIDGDFTEEHLAKMNSLIDRAREIMMNKARAYDRFDIDQLHIRNNDLKLAQMLGIDGEYVREKIKNKTVASREDIDGFIELPDGDQVFYHFYVGSGTLLLAGSGDTVIGWKSKDGSLWEQLKEAGLVFEVQGSNGSRTAAQLPTRDHPFVVRNLIIGNGFKGFDDFAFGAMHSLRSVYFMGPVQFIGKYTFSTHDTLVEVGFAQPESLVRIDNEAFACNHQLASINTPQSAEIH